jgi:hypothetical protein
VISGASASGVARMTGRLGSSAGAVDVAVLEVSTACAPAERSGKIAAIATSAIDFVRGIA